MKSLRRRATLYVVVICIAILGLEAWREWNAYDATMRRAVNSSANLAHSLRQHADDTLELAEHTVAAIVYEAQRAGFERGGLAATEARMRQSVGASSRLLRLDMYDPDGNWLATTAQNLPPGPRQTGYSYFQNHRASSSQAQFIGRPIQLPGGDWIFTVSQRLNRPDGSFGGVVVATLDCQYFAGFYSDFDVGPRGVISLTSSNGILLARSPYDPTQIGRNLSGVPLFSQLLATRRSGAYDGTSIIDNVPRIGAFDSSRRYPIVVVVATTYDEVLAPWFRGAVQRLGLTATLTLGLALLGLRLAEQIGRTQHSQTVLAEKETEFRLLAESASDLVERFAADGRRLYVSPVMRRLLGRSPEELVGTNAFETVHADDRPAVLAAADRLRRGESTQETVVFRATHADGREIWLETALRVSTDIDQQRTMTVGVSRDVTERKRLEMQLASLAAIDGLTGLGNRRVFDETLAREVSRACRGGQPLSLLMIDCDRFKRFNDDYGHLAGDSCLKAIARVVLEQARRPSDLAARYGGEELALLLPDTPLDAARSIGIDICRQVQGLGIAHHRNLPWMTATVSIGVATLDHQGESDTRDGIWLVTTADLALYDAKAQGRNQCIITLPPRQQARLFG